MSGPRKKVGSRSQLVVGGRDKPLGQQELERLACQMYSETFKLLEEPELKEVAKHRVTAMYGPPMVRPDLALVSFQGGAGDDSPSGKRWPKKLLYLDDDFRFGEALRSQFALAEMSETLERRTVAMAACFPEAPQSEANSWMRKTGPKAEWREFSVAWVRQMVAAMRPQVVLVFGKKASEAMGLEGEWRDEERDSSRGWRGFGRTEIEGCPALYCQHLSQGWDGDYVQLSLREAGRLIRA
ncbi:MAG: hypothetical protein F4171_05920 [Gammaproteobacteria bacterium]|nr:hypothetical protein [Gammaproteobacteria bacterium]MYH16740.1 hypothetical protein [Gammaproteobacteria bacterium]MYK84735.1 hypothetical protein [Gammaproteobacteria bacterium]